MRKILLFTVAISSAFFVFMPKTAHASFEPALNFTVDNPNSVAAADFNRDGKTDLVVTNFNGGDVSILLNISKP